MKAFAPKPASTVNIDVSASNQSVKVANIDKCGVRVMNNGSATVWITFGNSAVSATTGASMPIPAGGVAVFEVGSGDGTALYVAAIAAGVTGKIYFTPGYGI